MGEQAAREWCRPGRLKKRLAATTALELNPDEHAGAVPTLSTTAAQLPREADWQGELTGDFTGPFTTEVSESRLRYREELSRASCDSLTSAEAALMRLTSQINRITDNRLRQEILMTTLPSLAYSLSDSAALSVERLFEDVQGRRQAVLTRGDADANTSVHALLRPVLNQDRLF